MSDGQSNGEVLVEVVDLVGSGTRQIDAGSRAVESIERRKDEIAGAITSAVAIARNTADEAQREQHGFGVSELEIKFGISIAAEAGVVITKASAEATLEVTVKLAFRGARDQ